MNAAVSSREQLAEAARTIMEESGPDSVSIRAVASRCDVSVGCVYNYFADKEDLLAAAVGNVWQQIFSMPREPMGGFADSVGWIMRRARQGSAAYPQFLVQHGMSFSPGERVEGRQAMAQCFDHMKSGLLSILRQDKNIRTDAFGDEFTVDGFVTFVFDSMIAGLSRDASQDAILLTIIRRILYETAR